MFQPKKHKILSFIFRVIQIILLIVTFFAVGILVFKIWQYSPVLLRKFNLVFNNTLIKPVGQQDSLTKLNVMLSQANLPVFNLQKQDESSAIASLSGDIQVTFSLTKDLSNQVATLQVILARFRIEGRKVNRIDLRYNNVVVN